MKEKELIQVSTIDKKDYILANENIEGKVREFLNRYHKIEVSMISILDNIIISNRLDYSGRSKEFEKIRKYLNEMESILNESDTRKNKRNSDDKS